MNKLFTTLLITACAGAMAQTVVYDYSASIKRLQPEIKNIKVNKTKSIGERYKVISEKVFGYVQLPKCTNCNGTLTSSDDEDTFTGTAWLTRNDSTLKKAAKGSKTQAAEINYYTKVTVKAKAAMFGAFIDITKESYKAEDEKNATKAWMSLSYAVPTYSKTLTSKYLLSSTNTQLPYGMLGYTQTSGTTVYETGFGTVTTTPKGKDTLGICGNVPGDKACTIVNQISGTLTGWPKYIGPCGPAPMWDICKFDDDGSTVTSGVICGTWTIKYDKNLTKDKTTAEQVEAIEKALKLSDYSYGIDETSVEPADIPSVPQAKSAE